MPVTIKVNGVANSLVHKGSNGISTATIPDVCKTPTPGGPVPMPYPNISQSATLAKGTTTVKADGGMMIAVKGSEFSLSNGDNAGVAGGVKSSTFMKESTWILYSFDVKMDGKNACRLSDKKFHNHENTVNLAGEIQAAVAVAPGNWDIKCLLDILCKQDKNDVKKASKLNIVGVDPLVFDDPVYKGGSWTTKEFHAGGTQKAGEIQMVRNMSCEDAAVTLHHELLHSDQPNTMSWPEKEYDAYKRTEEWAIQRGLPSQHADFRKSAPMLSGQFGPGAPVVDEAAIKRNVDKWYPFTPPAIPGGPTPPQVVGRTADGKRVILQDSAGNQSLRSVQEGDTFPANKPRNPPNEKQIPPKDFKCP